MLSFTLVGFTIYNQIHDLVSIGRANISHIFPNLSSRTRKEPVEGNPVQVKLEVPDYELGGGGCEEFDPVGGTTRNQNGVKEEVVEDDKDADDGGAPPKRRRRKRRRARVSLAESSK